MKKQWFYFLMCGLFAMPLTVRAQEGDHPKGMHMMEESPMNEEEMAKDLQLNDQQREALKNHREQMKEQMKSAGEQLRAKRDELRKALSEANFDESKVKNIAQEVKSLQAQMLDSKISGVLKVKSILTPEQFIKFQQKASERMEKMQEMRKEHWKDRKGNKDGSEKE